MWTCFLGKKVDEVFTKHGDNPTRVATWINVLIGGYSWTYKWLNIVPINLFCELPDREQDTTTELLLKGGGEDQSRRLRTS